MELRRSVADLERQVEALQGSNGSLSQQVEQLREQHGVQLSAAEARVTELEAARASAEARAS